MLASTMISTKRPTNNLRFAGKCSGLVGTVTALDQRRGSIRTKLCVGNEHLDTTQRYIGDRRASTHGKRVLVFVPFVPISEKAVRGADQAWMDHS